MCLHFGLVATNAMDKISLAKHFVFMSVGRDQKFSLGPPRLNCTPVQWGV